MAEIATHAKEPWPSLDTAAWIFDRASFVLVGSLVLGVLATIAIVWMGIVKEHHWDLAREAAAKSIATLSLQGDQLRKDTAEANERAAEAKLALEKFRAPRTLSPEQQGRITEKLKQFANTKFDAAAVQDTEATRFLVQIENSLAAAGWVQIEWKGGDIVLNRPGRPTIGMTGSPGLTIAVEASWLTQHKAAAEALLGALQAEGFTAKGIAEPLAAINANPEAIHLLIGRKE